MGEKFDCMEVGHIAGIDSLCINCDERIGFCKDCGEDTENINLLCEGCNLDLLDEMDQDDNRFAEQYGMESYL